MSQPYSVCWTEDCGATALARVKDLDGDYVTIAGISSITCKVFDLSSDTPTTAVQDLTLTVSAVVFDTLQTGSIWGKDTTGYNFKHTIPAAAFPTGEHQYKVEYFFTPAAGEPFALRFIGPASSLIGS